MSNSINIKRFGNLSLISDYTGEFYCFNDEAEMIVKDLVGTDTPCVSVCSNGTAAGKYIYSPTHKDYEWIDYQYNGEEFYPIRKLMGSELVTFTPHDWNGGFPTGCTSMEEVRQWLLCHCNNGPTWTHYGDNVFFECKRQLEIE